MKQYVTPVPIRKRSQKVLNRQYLSPSSSDKRLIVQLLLTIIITERIVPLLLRISMIPKKLIMQLMIGKMMELIPAKECGGHKSVINIIV